MKVGETKKIRLEPKDAYGEEYIEQTKLQQLEYKAPIRPIEEEKK